MPNIADLMNKVSKVERGTLADDLTVTDDVAVGGDLDVTGSLTVDGTLTVTGALTVSGALTGARPVEATTAETSVLTAAMSGKVFVQTRASTTVTYSLPAAAAGLFFTFICGHASSEILITPVAGDAIVTKIHSAQDGTALAPAAGTGIKNTALSNVIGDSITLVALDGTTWYGTSIIGLWASQ